MTTCFGIDVLKTVSRTPKGERVRIKFDSNRPSPEAEEILLRFLDLDEPVVEGVGVISGIIKMAKHFG